MKLHEYQSKALMKSFGLPVLRGFLCYSPGEVEAAAENLGSGLCFIKAQVHAGGRGKAGGVKPARNTAEARSIGESMIGMKLVSKQTGLDGILVRKVYVEEGCAIDKELYLSILYDYSAQALCIIASAEGGIEIEEVAQQNPEKILTVQVDSRVGLQPFQAHELLLELGIDLSLLRDFEVLLSKLYSMFVQYDLLLIEINPLVITKDKKFILLDAKCSVDRNALYRQPELRAFVDYDETDHKELQASKYGLDYIALDGQIGCMVNGAGLAMATMDIIKLYGGSPANFLDVGGRASIEAVREAFKILLLDPKVKTILVNIFGGIVRCDVLAQGIIEAAKELAVKVPLVVRLQGTNVEIGREILKKSKLPIITADTMADAAEKAVKVAG